MASKILAKPCRCAACGEPMAAGEPFAWEEGSRWATSHGRSHTGARQAGSVAKVTAWKPRHPHPCLEQKVQAARARRADELIALAAQCGIASPEFVAETRRKIMAGEA
jgi:hypothetical protein